MTKWWSRQPNPYDWDPIWEGPFETEAEALASLIVPPGEHWGGTVSEESDDFDPWEPERPRPAPHVLAARIKAMAAVRPNRVAAEHQGTNPGTTQKTDPPADIVGQIERIVKLEQAGAITSAQAEELKAKLISGV